MRSYLRRWYNEQVENLLSGSSNTATFEYKTFFNSSHTNEIDPEQKEPENEPQDMWHAELAIQSMRNNKSPGIDYIPCTNSTA
jgi:hypothetical protein